MDTDKLLTIIKELADELEDEIKDRYCDMRGDIHPAMKRRFDRDMITVNEARAILVEMKQWHGNKTARGNEP